MNAPDPRSSDDRARASTVDVVGGTPVPRPDPVGDTPRRLGRYRIDGVLGRGGVGIVYDAFDESLGRPVALKTLLPGRDGDTVQVERFLREVRAAAQLQHPHVVPVFDAGTADGRVYLAMKRIEGSSLQHQIDQRGPLPPREAVKLLLPIVRALGSAHREGIVHRDVKPENVLVDEHGQGYLTDFGLARDLAELDRLTQSGCTVGTPAYMAPEQVMGQPVDPRADLYSVGATLFECLTGRVPFEPSTFGLLVHQILKHDPPSLRSLNPRVAPELEAVVLSCLEKQPRRRYRDAEALAEDLERFVRGEAVRARPPTWSRRWLRRARRHATLLVGVSVAGVGLLGGLGYGLAVHDEMAAAQRVAVKLAHTREHLLRAHRDAIAQSQREEARRRALAEAALATTTEGGIAAYDELLDQFPDVWEGRVARAQLLRRLCQEQRVGGHDLPAARRARAQAIRDLRRAADASARPEPLWLVSAEIARVDARDLSQARAFYVRLEGGRDTALASYARGRLAEAEGDMERALACAMETLVERPDLTPARLLEAVASLRLGRPDQALCQLDLVAGRGAVEAECALLRARVSMELGDLASSRAHAVRAVELDPENPEAHVVLGLVWEALGRPGQAAVSFQRAGSLDVGSAVSWVRLAQIHAAWNDLKRASAYLERAEACDDADASALHGLRERLTRAREEARLVEALPEVPKPEPSATVEASE